MCRPTSLQPSVANTRAARLPAFPAWGARTGRTKDRVRKAVAAVAEQVVELHRVRAAATGYTYEPDTPWQREMEALVPLRGDARSDAGHRRRQGGHGGRAARWTASSLAMSAMARPRSRFRAAFKAVQAGKQVAVLCSHHAPRPTASSDLRRAIQSYPVRCRGPVPLPHRPQQKAGRRRYRHGRGRCGDRHPSAALRGRPLEEPGPSRVDEEQRFGVAAKDQLSRLKVGVDVLTLTATPIPRTLEMALTGIRDVSHIRTAPEDRHPILTYVGPYDEQSVSAAIRRELLREGQVFYVHNRVRSIDRARRPSRRPGAGRPLRRRPRADVRRPARAGDARFLERRIRRDGGHHHHRVRARPAPGEHPDRRAGRPAGTRPALSAARAGGSVESAGLCLSLPPGRPGR